MNSVAIIRSVLTLYRSLPPEPADDPGSGLLGFVGPEGLTGLLPRSDEPPIVDPPPEGELADGLLVKPEELEPDIPEDGSVGIVVAPPALPGAVVAPLEPPPMGAPPPAAPAAPPPAPLPPAPP
jgi:hypothetical protein